MYGIQRTRNWPLILALHELPAWGESDLPELYADYRAEGGVSLDFEGFAAARYVRNVFRTEPRFIRREDYEAAVAACSAVGRDSDLAEAAG